MSRRLRESRQADEQGGVGSTAARGIGAGDGRRVDLRPRPGRAQPDPLGDEPFQGGCCLMTDKIVFTLDGQEVEAGPSETIWQVAKRLGTTIPHLCWKDAPGYRADGNCRACMVEVEGERVLAASCIRRPTEGMKVKAASDRAKTARQMVFELLVTDQPERATSRDPQSKLWSWAVSRGLHTAR